nr:hypothetical protein [Methylomarinum sp. Ch1-1]MDP4521132.1 hypothetical protein [Methylomarinum sp. Ch1-1]
MNHAQRIRQCRAASRSKPPNPAPGENWPLCISRRIAWRRIHPTVAMPFVGCAEQREAHQKLVRFLSSAHPTRIRKMDHAQRIRQKHSIRASSGRST